MVGARGRWWCDRIKCIFMSLSLWPACHLFLINWLLVNAKWLPLFQFYDLFDDYYSVILLLLPSSSSPSFFGSSISIVWAKWAKLFVFGQILEINATRSTHIRWFPFKGEGDKRQNDRQFRVELNISKWNRKPFWFISWSFWSWNNMICEFGLHGNCCFSNFSCDRNKLWLHLAHTHTHIHTCHSSFCSLQENCNIFVLAVSKPMCVVMCCGYNWIRLNTHSNKLYAITEFTIAIAIECLSRRPKMHSPCKHPSINSWNDGDETISTENGKTDKNYFRSCCLFQSIYSVYLWHAKSNYPN